VCGQPTTVGGRGGAAHLIVVIDCLLIHKPGEDQMELGKEEIEIVAQLISGLEEQHGGELNQLELLMVGGGFGDAILA
jgi:hypothetical protein